MKKVRRILCFGDSNTYGYIPGRGGRYDSHTRWPGRLGELLGEDYQVIEDGLCGRTTVFEDMTEPGRRGVDRIGEAVERYAPLDLLVIMLGSNDCKRQFHASAEEITGGLRKVLEKARDCAAGELRILLISPTKLTERIVQGGFGAEFDMGSVETSAKLARTYEELAEECGCDFLDGTKATRVSEADGLHLDAEGHRMLAEAVLGRIGEMEGERHG